MAGGADAGLEASDGGAESLGTDQHVTSLGNLKLISVLTEESAVGVEGVNGGIEFWRIGVSGRSWLIATVVLVRDIVVIVVTVELVMACTSVLTKFSGGGECEHSCCECVHFVFDLIMSALIFKN